jgi:hypothetical protein
MSSQQPLCPVCLEFQKNTGIDIEHFLQKLTAIKQKNRTYNKGLSSQEIEYICLSLSGYSKAQLAFYFYKRDRRIPNEEELNKWDEKSREMKIGQLNSEMSRTVHKYINELMAVEKYFPGWVRVIEFLQNKGYDRSSPKNIQIIMIRQIQGWIEHEDGVDIDESEISQELQQILQDKMNRRIKLRISLVN